MSLIEKIKSKGLRGSLRALREKFLYRHLEMFMLERQLDLPMPNRPSVEHWPLERIEYSTLPKMKAHFAHFIPHATRLLEQSFYGHAHLDKEGNVACMGWIAERTFYDDYYCCWVPLPEGCIFQFAGEVAKIYQKTGIVMLAERLLWKVFSDRGFKTLRTLIEVDNQPSLATATRLHFKEIGEIWHLYRLFGRIHFTRIERYDGLRLSHLRGSDGHRRDADAAQ